jgi:hypothetical protein
MALRTVAGVAYEFVKYSEQIPETIIAEGTYLGSVIEGQFKKPSHKIKTTSGKYLKLPSAGQLDKAVLGLKVGDYVVVTFKGKETMRTGEYAGRKACTFLVQVDDEKFEASPVEASGSQEAYDSDEDNTEVAESLMYKRSTVSTSDDSESDSVADVVNRYRKKA